MQFVDAHSQFLSALIDGGVYAALVSLDGGSINGPLGQRIVSGSEF
jgi:hypothetical protein